MVPGIEPGPLSFVSLDFFPFFDPFLEPVRNATFRNGPNESFGLVWDLVTSICFQVSAVALCGATVGPHGAGGLS